MQPLFGMIRCTKRSCRVRMDSPKWNTWRNIDRFTIRIQTVNGSPRRTPFVVKRTVSRNVEDGGSSISMQDWLRGGSPHPHVSCRDEIYRMMNNRPCTHALVNHALFLLLPFLSVYGCIP